MKKKECPSCAMEIDASGKVCPICGYEFSDHHGGILKWVAIGLLVLSLLYIISNIDR